jgi:hypothetical protein
MAKDFSAVSVAVRPGDLILYHFEGFQFFADAVEWFEGDGEVSHCSTALLPDGTIADARITGIHREHVSRYFKDNAEITVRRIKGMSGDDLDALVFQTALDIGKPYGFLKLMWNMFALMMQKVGLGRLFWTNNPFRSEDQGHTCSGLYAVKAARIGKILVPGKDPENVTPDDLYYSQAMETVVIV